jgi:hypothetical protein
MPTQSIRVRVDVSGSFGDQAVMPLARCSNADLSKWADGKHHRFPMAQNLKSEPKDNAKSLFAYWRAGCLGEYVSGTAGRASRPEGRQYELEGRFTAVRSGQAVVTTKLLCSLSMIVVDIFMITM